MPILFSILTLYTWVLGAGLIWILRSIARFYQKKHAELYQDTPPQRTYYQFFIIPIISLLLAAILYAILGDFSGHRSGDIAFLVGGVVLTWSSYHLHKMMTGGR